MSPKKRRVVLSVSLITLTVITIALLPSDMLIAARFHDALNTTNARQSVAVADYDAPAKNDPHIGDPFPRSGAAAEIRRQAAVSKRGCLVVGLGDCAGCVAFNLRQWETQAREERVPLVGFTLASVSDASKFKAAAGVNTRIITDDNNALHKSLNCYWSGRVYYYDAKWNLMWIMKGFANNKNLHRSPDLVALIRSSK